MKTHKESEAYNVNNVYKGHKVYKVKEVWAFFCLFFACFITRMKPLGYGEGCLAMSISIYRSNAFLKTTSPPGLEASCNPMLSYT